MSISQVISLLCGVALFLFGMTLMGDGLKHVSGNKLEPILFRLSSTQFRGVLLGTGVTAVIQSSCATSVMVVGFVNSGMMKVRQAISVILGAILGTSITGWVICLSYIEGTGGLSSLLSTATLTGIIAVVGILLRMFSKKQTHHHVGDIMMGFAILMTGMSTMSGSVSSLGQQPWFIAILTSMTNPLLGILAGAAFTAILQSASAAVGIIQALSVTGAMTLSSALPLLMGVSIGASVPVLLSALGANIDGKRTAFSYLVASFMGTMVCASVFYIADTIFHFPFMSRIMSPFSLAFVNTLLRLAMILLLAPFTDVLEAVISLMVPEKKQTREEDPTLRLEERFLGHPALAIEQSRITISAMAEQSRQALETAFSLLTSYSEEGFETVERMESAVDRYEDCLGSYLVKLTGRELSEQQSREASKFLHTLSDFERISDHALNIAESAREIHEKQLRFSDNAKHELSVTTSAVSRVMQLTVNAFETENLAQARQVEPLEDVIDYLCDEMKLRHVDRLQHGQCTIAQGFVFNDLITNLERISDHCSNVAVAMIELDAGTFDTHEYLDHVREKHSREFEQYSEQFRKQFAL
ncbi:MAG: Na/Pi cotransporter family protein [Oscillospiraceae bacterium]|nr:Na/Pi cotransporter family protein [Oscillospiraceae bacterium]